MEPRRDRPRSRRLGRRRRCRGRLARQRRRLPQRPALPALAGPVPAAVRAGLRRDRLRPAPARSLGPRHARRRDDRGDRAGTRIMPCGSSTRAGTATSSTIARGVRFACAAAPTSSTSRRASRTAPARDLPRLLPALREARRRGRRRRRQPATACATGARTDDDHRLGDHDQRLRAAYSNYGDRIDLVAPGGGDDADVPGDARCAPSVGRRRRATGFRGDPRRLTVRGRDGTSMAAPHVAAAAALVTASGVPGAGPSPRDVKRHLRATARDLGEEFSYGAGLVDVAAVQRFAVGRAPG